MNLASWCLRPFEPYTFGDRVEVSIEGSDEYLRGEIVAVVIVDGSDRFDIQTDYGILTMVTDERLRRFKRVDKPLIVGSRVMARFQGGYDAYPATIRVMYSDGTAAILYDDGDYERLDLEFVTAL